MIIQIAGGVVLAVLVLAFLLLGRVRRSRVRDVRPTLPPSPYQPSRGFRILDGTESAPPPSVQLPRLDPNTEFVFGENTPAPETPTPHLRHDDQWALNRSMRHRMHPRRRRRLGALIVVVLVVAALLVALLLGGHHAAHHALGAYASFVAPSS